MKKFNYNLILFAAAVLIVFGGLISRPLVSGVKNAVVKLVYDRSVTEFIKNVDNSSKELSYKTALIDLNSILYRITDTSIVEKDDATVIRMDNDYLCFEKEPVPDETLNWMTEQLCGLKSVADEMEIPFVAVITPTKETYTEPDAPSDKGELSVMLKSMISNYEKRGIDVLDLPEMLQNNDMSIEDIFFVTDHHWKPEMGMWAAEEIYNALQMEYDPVIFDISNYNVAMYKNWFLGSQGKKVGQYFTPYGVDDFDLITPEFETSFTVTEHYGVRTGGFENSVIYMDHLATKDLYTLNPYAAYSGGDFPLQVIENNLAPEEGKEILIIRDSFACVVTPFLSLGAEKVHVVDSRYWGPVENAETVLDYIRLVEPDCVIFLSSGVSPDAYIFG